MPKRTRGIAAYLIIALCLLCVALPHAVADDLKGLDLPVFRDRAGFGLGITTYSLQTDADLLKGEDPEHSIELAGLLQAPEDEDVLCFSTTLLVKSAENSRGKDLLLPQRRRSNKDKKFRALVPSLKYKNRRGEPLMLSLAELDSLSLDRPGTELAELVLVATAVIVEERESEEISAQVADSYNDIGFSTSVQVSSIEVDKKSEMTVKLNVKHTGNKDLPVIDSVYALDRRGKVLGGGRWSNELELFGNRYEIELAFPVDGNEKSIDQLRIVLATEYEIEQIEFTIEDLFTR
ncbi:MAG: hypothetical protein AB8C95_14730 [Phycisphaeraceae bacterium]